MCGKWGPFRGKFKNPRIFGIKIPSPFGSPPRGGPDPEAERIKLEQEAATAANLQIAQQRRRRRRGSLLGAGRSVLGARAGGSPSGAGSGGGSGGGGSGSRGGSALGGGGSSGYRSNQR